MGEEDTDVLNLKSERARVPACAYPRNSGNRAALHGETDPIRCDPTRDWASARSAWFTMISAKHISPFPARGCNFDGITAAVAWSPRNTLVAATPVQNLLRPIARSPTSLRESAEFSTFIFVLRLPGSGLPREIQYVQCFDRALIISRKLFLKNKK